MASNEEQTSPRPEDVEETLPQILKTLDVSTLIREMKVNGCHLVERKQTTNVPASDDTPKMTIIIHSRLIVDSRWGYDERCYDIQETLTEGMDEPDRVIEATKIECWYDAQENFTDFMDDPGQLIEDPMTLEEVEWFKEDWNKLWNPQAQGDSSHFD